MTREILFESLKENLRDLSLEEFVGLFINRTKAIEEFYKLSHGISAGKNISLLFNPHRLATDTEKDDLSIFESLQDDSKLSGLARLYLYNLENGCNDAFFSTIQRGYQNIQYVNEFPPIVARKVYSSYGRLSAKYEKGKQLRILDPCAGWGGRMIGAASLGNVYYEACEPSTETYKGLKKLGKWLKMLQPKFEFKINHVPYEEFDDEKKFDVALTSPPYYNTEHYSDEPTNSLNKFGTFEEWIEGFYKPLILDTVARLEKDAVFIINVGDRKYPLTTCLKEICEDNKLYCERVYDYLSGNGEKKEQFYCISKKQKFSKKRRLF